MKHLNKHELYYFYWELHIKTKNKNKKKNREKKERNSLQNISILGWYLYYVISVKMGISPASPNLAMHDHATNYHMAFHHADVRALHL